jgi:hypothetical protein
MTSSKPNQFAKFVSASPLSTIPHDPTLTLTSNCIRDFFGPTVQLVADGLLARGESTLAELTTYIENQCGLYSQKSSHERMEMIRLANNTRVILPNRENDECPSRASIRASLVVLIQHSIVNVKHMVTTPSSSSNTAASSSSKNKRKRCPGNNKVVCRYQVDLDRGRFLMRYPRYVEYIKKTIGATAAALLEEILVHGRLPTVCAIVRTVAQLEKDYKQQEHEVEENDEKTPTVSSSSANTNLSDKQAIRKSVMESLMQLIRGGYLQQVSDLRNGTTLLTSEIPDEDEGEFEFGNDNDKKSDDNLPANKKQKRSVKTEEDTLVDGKGEDDTAVVALLQSEKIFTIPPKAMWRVNVAIFHEQLRALQLGWLVYERYGSRIDKSGSIVTAGLKVVATRRHAPQPLHGPTEVDVMNRFSVKELLIQLPPQLQKFFERKPDGAIQHLYQTLIELCRVNAPKVAMEWDVAPGNVAEAQFQINTRRLVDYFRDRIVHQVSFFRNVGSFCCGRIMSFL